MRTKTRHTIRIIRIQVSINEQSDNNLASVNFINAPEGSNEVTTQERQWLATLLAVVSILHHKLVIIKAWKIFTFVAQNVNGSLMENLTGLARVAWHGIPSQQQDGVHNAVKFGKTHNVFLLQEVALPGALILTGMMGLMISLTG
jgi:hypothetical protein